MSERELRAEVRMWREFGKDVRRRAIRAGFDAAAVRTNLRRLQDDDD